MGENVVRVVKLQPITRGRRVGVPNENTRNTKAGKIIGWFKGQGLKHGLAWRNDDPD